MFEIIIDNLEIITREYSLLKVPETIHYARRVQKFFDNNFKPEDIKKDAFRCEILKHSLLKILSDMKYFIDQYRFSSSELSNLVIDNSNYTELSKKFEIWTSLKKIKFLLKDFANQFFEEEEKLLLLKEFDE